MIWSIAWRNIWRNKLRSLVVILAVALGLFGTLFMLALSNGMVVQKVDAAINLEISQIQIHHPDFLQDNSLRFYMADAGTMLARVRSVPGVKAVTSRIKAMAMASTAANASGVIVNGIDPLTEKDVTLIHTCLIEGHYFEEPSRTPQALISKKLASELKASIGSRLVLTIQGSEGALVYGLFRVSGIYKTSNVMFDEPNIFVMKDDLAGLAGFNPANASEIAIMVSDIDATETVAEVLRSEFPGLSIHTWKELEPMLLALSSMMHQMAYILLLIILAAMAFAIVNTMLMVILERSRELGMLLAVGMNRRRVFWMIVLETVLLTLTGTLAGLAVSITTITLTSRNGINFSAWAEGFEAFGYNSLVYPSLYWHFYATMTLMAIVTAVLSALYPARKALRFNPAAAIREEG
jgi:ABC-type lipoprotein release transport system permease subunit